jgi:predicted amidohydrolase
MVIKFLRELKMIKISIIQMNIMDGQKDVNLNNALSYLQELSSINPLPEIVCLPELFTTGYDLKNVKKLAEPLAGDTINKILAISKGKFIVIGTILEKDNGHFYNTAFILDKNGEIIGKYRKTHLFSPMLEKEFLTAGNAIPVFSLSEFHNLKVGLAICYDLRFPGLFRALALQGAEIIFVPSEFPSPKNEIWRTLLIARAIENQVFVVGINRVGKGKSDSFFGNSLITNGSFHQILGTNPSIKMFELDLSSIKEIREKLPLLKDRRDDLYNLSFK